MKHLFNFMDSHPVLRLILRSVSGVPFKFEGWGFKKPNQKPFNEVKLSHLIYSVKKFPDSVYRPRHVSLAMYSFFSR